LRLLFVFRTKKAVEPFVGVVQRCLDRGHTVQVVVPTGESKVPAFFDPNPNLSFASIGLQRGDQWRDSEPLLRSARDYLQYLKPAYRDARKLRNRAFEHLLERLPLNPDDLPSGSAERALALSDETVWRLVRLAALCEDSMPPDPLHERVIERFNPDAVLISPLLHFGSAQADVAKAARFRGVPVGMMLFSWDNLSTKGALHVPPDRLFVWNERQQREAVELHGIPAEHIRITGAPRFDAFFALKPRVNRDVFCRAIGLDPANPILLYLCSSKLVSEREAAFIRQWHATIRHSADERLRTAGIIVRPHPDLPVADKKWLGPEETSRWEGVEGPALARRLMFGHKATVMLYSDSDRALTLHECIRHSHAVVGLNTSAEIEAGILGRPVLTVLADEESVDGQRSTLHFKYLLEEDGGFVKVSESLGQHEEQLCEVLAHPPDPLSVQQRAGDFVRPGAWDRPAAEVLVEALEQEFEPRGSSAEGERRRETPVYSSAAVDGPMLERRLPRGDRAQVVRISYAGPELYLATSSPEEASRADLDQRSPWILRWLADVVGPGDVLYIAAADVGALALVAARGLGASVFAFEANIPRLARLWENIVLNGCEGSLVPLPVALAEERSIQKEHCESVSPVSKRDVPVRTWRPHRETGLIVVQPCAALTLDDSVKIWSLPAPKVLYLGQDARVAAILGGGTRTLEQVRSCLVECSGTDVKAVIDSFGKAGFALRDEQTQPAGKALRFDR
jgi:hypothetical protein